MMNNQLSEKPWGEVDKDELLKFVIDHPNMANKIYLKIEKDWQDSPRERLSYPIADKNGTVYRYGLSSALSFARANNETEVVKKVKSLYKKYEISEVTNMKSKQEAILEGLHKIDEKDRWVTIKGTHVLVDDKGNIKNEKLKKEIEGNQEKSKEND